MLFQICLLELQVNSAAWNLEEYIDIDVFEEHIV